MAVTLTEKEIVDLKDAFAIFDKDNDGYIKKAEVKNILIAIGKDGTNEEVRRVIAEFDTDGDGLINFAEFLNMMAKNCSNSAMESEGALQHMFKIFDRDNDGFITHTEMKRALDEMDGGSVPHSEVEGMIREADQDDDGKVSFSEFEAVMKQKYPGQYH